MCQTQINCDGLTAEPPRADRIKHEVARSKRLRDWVTLFRIDGERGLGDTVLRLKPLAKSRELKDDLRKLLRICACHDDVAAGKLNEQYPY